MARAQTEEQREKSAARNRAYRARHAERLNAEARATRAATRGEPRKPRAPLNENQRKRKLELQRVRYARNPEKFLVQQRARDDAQRTRDRACARRWKERNKAKSKKKQKLWVAENTDKVRAQKRRWYARHRDERTAYMKALYESEPDKIKKRVRAYVKAHPVQKKLAEHRRRVQKLASGGAGLTTGEWESLLAQFGRCCAYCGKPGTTIDHVVPLAKGGRHEIENILPACISCNASKNDKDLDVWLAQKGYADPRQRMKRAC